MSYVAYRADGTIRITDRAPRAADRITEEDVKEPARLVLLLERLIGSVTELLRRRNPKTADFEDTPCSGDGVTQIPFAHGFKGRVRWWVVDWEGPGLTYPSKGDQTTDDVLTIVTYTAGVATIRVEKET